MKKLIASLILISILTACSTALPPANEAQLEFSEAFLVNCTDLPLPDDAASTLGDLFKYTKGLQTQYSDCAVRTDALINMVRKENIKIRQKNEAK